MIIGLTGSMGCGKGEIVNILERFGFKYITLSTIVREETRARGLPEEREQLMEVGNDMRKLEGAGVLAKRVIKKIEESGYDKWVVDGIRNPAEIEEIKKVEDSYVVGVNANRELLIERILSRNRESDAKVRSEVLRKIEREWGNDEPEDGQQVGRCMEMTDILIDNEGTLEELAAKFEDFYNSIK